MILSISLVTACASTPPRPAPPAAPPSLAAPASASAAPSAPAVPESLRFTATTLDGAAFDGSSLAGRPVVFWFWAPWCPKCQVEGPAVAKTARRYADRVTFVGVAGLDKSKQAMTAFVARTGTGDVIHLDDRDGAIYRHFRVTTQSSFLAVGVDGRTTPATGPLDVDELSSLAEQHLR